LLPSNQIPTPPNHNWPLSQSACDAPVNATSTGWCVSAARCPDVWSLAQVTISKEWLAGLESGEREKLMRLMRLMRRFPVTPVSTMARSALCVLGAALLAVGQCAPTYYVSSTTGSDTNEGSQTKPWATLEHAVAAIDAQGMVNTEMQRFARFAGCSIAHTSESHGTYTTSLSHFVASVTCVWVAMGVDGLLLRLNRIQSTSSVTGWCQTVAPVAWLCSMCPVTDQIQWQNEWQ